MTSRYMMARAQEMKAHANTLAEFMDEFTLPGTPVYDEQGHLMTKEQVVERARNEWREEVRRLGINPDDVP